MKSWLQQYDILLQYIREHPDIRITRNAIITPENSRENFYRVFDAVRTAFIEQNVSDSIEELRNLANAYSQLKDSLIASTIVESTTMPPDLIEFTNNLDQSVIKPVFRTLFDLLQGKTDLQTFQTATTSSINAYIQYFTSTVFEKWILLGMIKHLKPQELFVIPADAQENHRIERFIQQETFRIIEPPKAISTRTLSFISEPEPLIITPDFVLQIRIGNRISYLAVRTGFRYPSHCTVDLPQMASWVKTNMNAGIGKSEIMVYFDSRLSNLSVIADNKRMRKPDICIKYLSEKSEDINACVEDIRCINDHLNPCMGTYLISRNPVNIESQNNLLLFAKTFDTGLDQIRLERFFENVLSVAINETCNLTDYEASCNARESYLNTGCEQCEMI